jgi:hypothetical protein
VEAGEVGEDIVNVGDIAIVEGRVDAEVGEQAGEVGPSLGRGSSMT